MGPGLKAVVIVCAGYFATLLGAGLVSFVLMIVLSPHTCAQVGRALMGVWTVLGLCALGSIAVVGALLWRLALGAVARVLLALAYAVVLLVSFAAIALFATIAANC